MSQIDLKALQTNMAIHKGASSLDNAISTLERVLRELKRRRDDYDNAEELGKKADVLNWTINDLVCNITPNLRIDQLADAQAELKAAH